jgi:hypothetical protein
MTSPISSPISIAAISAEVPSDADDDKEVSMWETACSNTDSKSRSRSAIKSPPPVASPAEHAPKRPLLTAPESAA